MSTPDPLTDFLAQRTLAVVGVSRNPQKWGNIVWRDLKSKGYTVYAINPHVELLDGDRVYPNLASLPEPVDGIVVVTPPTVSPSVIREAAECGITRVWLQGGAESAEALDLCRQHGIQVISGVCVMVKSR